MSFSFEKAKLAIGLLFIGFCLGILAQNLSHVIPMGIQGDVEIRGGGNFKFINPLLECDLGSDYISKNALYPFKPLVDGVISDEKAKGDISYASVYFRDLNNGPWFGINANDDFRPASLLKVPLMLNIMKLEEQNPGELDKKLVYNGEDLDLSQNIKPERQVEKGKTYTVWELVEYMIKYSDNKATAVLLKQVDDNRLGELFRVLGVDTPKNDTGQDNFISIRQYASFFRILFNASYLSYDLSEKALALLSEVKFDQGLRGGIPGSIKLSHKFGESVDAADSSKQLHDCGIVYYPKKPYLLCVSVRGTSFPDMEASVRAVSKATYAEVDRQVSSN